MNFKCYGADHTYWFRINLVLTSWVRERFFPGSKIYYDFWGLGFKHVQSERFTKKLWSCHIGKIISRTDDANLNELNNNNAQIYCRLLNLFLDSSLQIIQFTCHIFSWTFGLFPTEHYPCVIMKLPWEMPSSDRPFKHIIILTNSSSVARLLELVSTDFYAILHD